MTRTQPPRFAVLVRFAIRAPVGTCAALLALACGGGGSSAPTSPGGTTTTTVNNTVANISISGNATSVVVGSTITLAASARNAAGTVVTATIVWSSSNSAVATVGSSTGVVTGVAAGNATITATTGGISGNRVISVTAAGGGGTSPAPLTAFVDMPGSSFEPSSVTIGVGGTVTWNFTALTHNVLFGAGAGVSDIAQTQNVQVSRTFNTKGTFGMSCSLHPGMNGSITVQ